MEANPFSVLPQHFYKHMTQYNQFSQDKCCWFAISQKDSMMESLH